MGARATTMLQESEVVEIQKETGFSHNQIIRLYSRFTNLDRGNNGYLSREDLLRIPELMINPLGDRIVDAFFKHDKEETNFLEFMRTLAKFRPAIGNQVGKVDNSREAKLRFAFNMYDLDGDDKISQDELREVLLLMVGTNLPKEMIEHIADQAFEEVDLDHDGVISFDDFKQVMENVDVEQKMSIRFLH